MASYYEDDNSLETSKHDLDLMKRGILVDLVEKYGLYNQAMGSQEKGHRWKDVTRDFEQLTGLSKTKDYIRRKWGRMIKEARQDRERQKKGMVAGLDEVSVRILELLGEARRLEISYESDEDPLSEEGGNAGLMSDFDTANDAANDDDDAGTGNGRAINDVVSVVMKRSESPSFEDMINDDDAHLESRLPLPRSLRSLNDGGYQTSSGRLPRPSDLMSEVLKGCSSSERARMVSAMTRKLEADAAEAELRKEAAKCLLSTRQYEEKLAKLKYDEAAKQSEANASQS